MSKGKCNKKQSKKDLNFAVANTNRNKALKSYFTYKRSNFKDLCALESLAMAIHPEKIGVWVQRVNPENI